jgi:hypothetical protein
MPTARDLYPLGPEPRPWPIRVQWLIVYLMLFGLIAAVFLIGA